MAKAIVKCPYCEKSFDRLDPSIKFIKIGRRYAHMKCYNEHEAAMTQEEKDLRDLYTYIKDLLGVEYNFKKVEHQIKEFKKYTDGNDIPYTYSGMLASLRWFYEIKGNSKEAANGGIGIIPYIYNDAKKYYYNLYLAQQKNKQIKNYVAAIEEITIPPPEMIQPKPKLWFDDEEDDE